MRGPTLALIIGIVIVVIATVVALSRLSTTSTTSPSAPTATATQTTTTTATAPSSTSATATSTTSAGAIQYNPQLAAKGQQYFSQIGCIACHSISSLGISGGNVGPDLSKALLGNPGVPGDVLSKYFAENGLTNPAADPQKAAQLLAQFLMNPPDYASTMKAQVQAFKATYPNWTTDQVPALVELLKEAAAKATG